MPYFTSAVVAYGAAGTAFFDAIIHHQWDKYIVKKFKVPENVKTNIVLLYGDIGKKWLQDLFQFIKNYEMEWKFKTFDCFSDAQFNVVLDVIKDDGVPAVFKCCVPNKEFKTEVLALKHYNGYGAVKLFKENNENGAMLIERIIPGTLLENEKSIKEVTDQAIAVCNKLHKPVNDLRFPTLTDWFDGFHKKIYKKFNGNSGPFPKSLIEKAKSISDDLLLSQSQGVLLHGDLHYANIILFKDHYVAIDPKGVIGESEFEIPLPRVTNIFTKKQLLYFLDCFIEHSHYDKQRIYSWLFSKAMLTAWWTIEDMNTITEYTRRFLFVAEMLNEYL